MAAESRAIGKEITAIGSELLKPWIMADSIQFEEQRVECWSEEIHSMEVTAAVAAIARGTALQS